MAICLRTAFEFFAKLDVDLLWLLNFNMMLTDIKTFDHALVSFFEGFGVVWSWHDDALLGVIEKLQLKAFWRL